MSLAVAGCRPSHPERDIASEALKTGLEGLTLSEYQGKILFERHCVICHGDAGKGDGFNAYNLNPPPPDLTATLPDRTDDHLFKVILEGTSAVGKSPLCPPRRGILSPEEQKSLLSYLRRLALTGSP